MTETRREKQKSFLLNHRDPRPSNFYKRFNYRSRSNAHRDYELRLRQTLQETPQSEKLLNLKRGWERHEYDEDWARYEDEKIIRKADKKVKRGKLKAHVAFNENLNERLNIKKPSDKLASSSKDHGEVPKKTTNRQFKNQIGDTENKEIEDGIEEVNEYNIEESIPAEECEEMDYVKNDRQNNKLTNANDNNINEDESNIPNLTEFDNAYHELDPRKMWRLKSVKKKQNIDKSTINLMKKYSVKDLSEFRKIIFEPFLPTGTSYSNKEHFDLNYVRLAYSIMHTFWEADDDFSQDPSKLEGWYQLNIWGPLIDSAFRNSNINLIRVDGMSRASSDRKNQSNHVTDRKKIGRKGDGIFRLKGSRLEFGAIEAGREWEGEHGRKYIKDSLKLCKMLHDMLIQLSKEC
ncbi:8542_t:CDS:2, partial [Acaulospora morrowiae]